MVVDDLMKKRRQRVGDFLAKEIAVLVERRTLNLLMGGFR
jgi:hypothetical protein